MRKLFYLLLSVLVLSGCSEYQKALKSEDPDVKYAAAAKMYEKEKYSKAIRLFEQIAASYRGRPQAEQMYYMFAQSYYKTNQYYLAGYQFETFAAGYPRSEHLEEASFLSAKSYAKLSPVYSRDQTDTYKAIDKLQAFIDRFPESAHMPEANETVKALREKLEKKAFYNAKNYNKIYDYKSAIVALDNFIADYPGTPYKEEALYYRLDSAYNLAINSVPSKMEERLQQARAAHATLMKFNPSTKYKGEADDMLTRIDNDLKQYIK